MVQQGGGQWPFGASTVLGPRPIWQHPSTQLGGVAANVPRPGLQDVGFAAQDVPFGLMQSTGRMAEQWGLGNAADPADMAMAALETGGLGWDLATLGATAPFRGALGHGVRQMGDASAQVAANMAATPAPVSGSLAAQRGSLGGPRSKTADLDMLDIARQADYNGLPMERIRDATGWRKGVDGKWMYETSDVDAYMDPLAMMGDRASEVLQNPTLYAGYPQLRNTRMTFDASMPKGARGSVHPITGEVKLNPDISPAQQRRTALHEHGAHNVQRVEGKAMGGAASEFHKAAQEELKRLDTTLKMFASEFDEAEQGIGAYKDVPLAEREHMAGQLKQNFRELMGRRKQVFDMGGNKDNAYQTYRRLAGEAEARAVADRADLTADDLAMRSMFVSDRERELLGGGGIPRHVFDVPPEDQLVRFGPGGPIEDRVRRQQPLPEGRPSQQGTVRLGGREVPVSVPKRSLGDRELVYLKTQPMEQGYQRNKGYYIGPQGEGGIGDRYQKFGEFTEDADWIGAPEISVDDDGFVDFINGRHRYAYMRDQGLESIPVALDQASIRAARARGMIDEGEDILPPVSGPMEDAPRSGVQSGDVPPSPTDQPDKRGIYDAIRRDVTEALDPARATAGEPRAGMEHTGARGPQRGPFARTGVERGAADERTSPIHAAAAARYTTPRKEDLAAAGQSTGDFVELNKSSQAAKLFRDTLLEQKAALGDTGAQVEVYPRYTKDMRLFLSEDGQSGFAIKPDGDIVSVFSSSPESGRGTQMTLLATQEGGRKLDAFDSFLPEKIYNPAGYEDVAAARWNPDYAPEDWPAEGGTPDVATMVYRPRGPVRPYEQGAGPYPADPWEAQAPEVFAPELTPGVSRQLHTATERPVKATTRPTVKSPERKQFQRVYADPRASVERAAARIAPENPMLEPLTGMTRRDFDEIMLERGRRGQAEGMFEIPETRGAKYMGNIMTPANEQRLMDAMALGMADPRLAGSYGWYANDPLLEMYKKLWGPEKGLEEFQKFMARGSAVSPSSPVDAELRRASLMGLLETGGRQGEFIEGNLTSPARVSAAFPDIFPTEESAKGYSAIYHGTAHRPGLRRLEERGTFYPINPKTGVPETFLGAPKTPLYNEAKLGRNVRYAVPDAHHMRNIGAVDVRPTPGGKQPLNIGSASGPEAIQQARWFDDLTQRMGLSGVGGQALNWNLFGPATGVKTDLGKPFVELVIDAAQRETVKQGLRPTKENIRKTLEDFVLRKGKLGAMAAAALGLSTQEQPEEAM